MVDALSFPDDKRAHRFIPMDPEDFFYPDGRSDAYTVIEISLMEGRSAEARKKLIRLLFDRIEENVGYCADLTWRSPCSRLLPAIGDSAE